MHILAGNLTANFYPNFKKRPNLTTESKCSSILLYKRRLKKTKRMKTDKDSRKITNRIREKTSTIKYFIPANYEQEREKFFNSDSYNPVFDYPDMPVLFFKKGLLQLQEAKVMSADAALRKIEKNRLKETKYKVKLLLARGDPEKITINSERLYQCKFNNRYVEMARTVLNDVRSSMENDTRPDKLRMAFVKYLKKYKIKNWRIIISKQKDFNIQVRYKHEKVRISEEANLGFASLDSLLAHEVDGHIIRAVNAAKQKSRVFQRPLPFYIKTEEGLACYLGDYLAKNGELSKKHHAIKYLGSYLALNSSFREVCEFFMDNGLSPDLAFQRAMRIKRGFTDTSQPGCNAREAIYWEGMMDIKRYLENGGSLKKLYSGKIGLQDIEYIPENEDVILPKRPFL